ncbi:MAG: epoxyqueuosine reductase QueH [Candidatus Zixiibacteriota bacterium]|jgi:predicted adenine nucleotide alpha hydrolase (AANH) superfamily ATPase
MLHACCGRCLAGPARALEAEGHDLIVFWYNPNVQPYREYRKRLAAFREVASREEYRADVYDRYDIDYFLREVASPSGAGRCSRCYFERLSVTALRAREAGYEAFTTTLLVSPHQDQPAILEAGERAAAEAGVQFLARDFRPDDDESRRVAREAEIYVQGYCGCIYSEEERYRKKKAKPDDGGTRG